MIDPKSLRIGNLVLKDGQVFEIKTGADIDQGGYEGIPLSNDWMYKLDVDSLYWNPRIETFWVYKGEYYPVMINESRDGQFFFQENTFLKFVHQLQNLIFSITGDELKLKTGEHD